MRYIQEIVEYCWGNYVLLSSLAAALMSIQRICFKVITDTMSVFQVLVVRSFFVCVAMYLIVHLRQEKLFGDRSKYKILSIRTICAALTFITVYVATSLLPLVDATFLVSSYPMTTALLSFSLRYETLSWKSWIGVLGCIVGNGLILRPPFIFGGDEDEEWDSERILGVFIALLSIVFNSIVAILTSMLGTSISPYGAVFCSISVAFLISVPFVVFSVPQAVEWTPNLGEIGLQVLIVIVAILFHPIFYRGLQIGPPTKNSIILLTNMLYSALFGVLVLSEDADWFTLLGAMLIIASVVVISLDKSSSKTKPNYQVSNQEEQEQLL